MAQAFFDEQRDQSLVKAAIVAKYFDAWSRIMIANAAKGIPINRLGSGLVDHSQKMTVAAKVMAEKKAVGQRS